MCVDEPPKCVPAGQAMAQAADAAPSVAMAQQMVRPVASVVGHALAMVLLVQNGMFWMIFQEQLIPSGKHTKNYRKSPFSMGKSTTSMVIFNSYFDITRG